VYVRADALVKKFNRKPVLAGVSFEVQPGQVFGIVGRNGSGKSTLLRIVGALLSPSSGSITHTLDGHSIEAEHLHQHIGYAAPYLTLYEEFNARENLQLYASLRGMPLGTRDCDALLDGVGLPLDRRDPIRSYSSGMKQRMKLLFAVMHRPPLLLLDEPTSNLDSDGIAAVYRLVEEGRKRGAVIIATNDAEDIRRCDATISVEAVC